MKDRVRRREREKETERDVSYIVTCNGCNYIGDMEGLSLGLLPVHARVCVCDRTKGRLCQGPVQFSSYRNDIPTFTVCVCVCVMLSLEGK